VADQTPPDPSERKREAVTKLLRRWQELQRLRQPYEAQWREIAEYLGVTRGSDLRPEKGQLRGRRLFDGHGRTAKQRLTAQLHGGMVNPLSPWAIPVPLKGAPDEAARQWLDDTMRTMHAVLTSTASLFAVALAEYTDDLVLFGNAYVWLGRAPGGGPVFRAVSMWNCWVDVDQDGRVDTLYRKYEVAAWRAAERWPESEKLREAAKHDAHKICTIVHAIEPRQSFTPGLAADAPVNRRWREVEFYVEGPEILVEGGRDRFPWAVGRFYKRPDEIYGYGPADEALPDVKLANAIAETVLRLAEQAADPTLMMPTGFMMRKIDRRPGAVNMYDATKAALVRGDPVRELQRSGDVQLGVAMLEMIHDKIDAAFFTDWMTLPDGIAETATAVNDRKDLRAAGLAHMVVRQESEALDPIAEHAFVVMSDEDWFDEAPDALAGADVRFLYRTPLHLALQRGEVDAVTRFMALLQLMESVDPGVAKRKFDGAAAIDYVAERIGLPMKLLKSEADVKAAQAADEEAAAGQEEIANIQAGAQAARDGAQALASLGMQPEALGDMI
jgi:hypothetical protein